MFERPPRADAHMDAFEADKRVESIVRKAESIDIEGQIDEESLKKLDLFFASVWDEWDQHDKPESQKETIEAIVGLYESTSYYNILKEGEVKEKAGVDILLHLEGCDVIQQHEDVDYLHSRGIRSLGLLYNHDNKIGGGATGDPQRGLTQFGREVVTSAAEKGMIIDVAHANDKTSEEVLGLLNDLSRPGAGIYSHGAVRTKEASRFFKGGARERLLSSQRSLEIARSGGIVGLGVATPFFSSTKKLVDQVKRMSDTHGSVSHVAIGSDFGGFPNEYAIKGLETLDRIEVLHNELTKAGFPEEDIRGVMGENLIRYTNKILKGRRTS